MIKAITFLRENGVNVSDAGIILSELPKGEEGLSIVNELEDYCMTEDFTYTIIGNEIKKIDC